jgi:hypothetical protein
MFEMHYCNRLGETVAPMVPVLLTGVLGTDQEPSDNRFHGCLRRDASRCF